MYSDEDKTSEQHQCRMREHENFIINLFKNQNKDFSRPIGKRLKRRPKENNGEDFRQGT